MTAINAVLAWFVNAWNATVDLLDGTPSFLLGVLVVEVSVIVAVAIFGGNRR